MFASRHYLQLTMIICIMMSFYLEGFTKSKTPKMKVKHPVFSLNVKNLESTLKQVKTVMEIPDETLKLWNPPLADFVCVGCPNCSMGSQFRSSNLKWSPENPAKIECKYCKHVFPSPEYPLRQGPPTGHIASEGQSRWPPN